MHSSPDPLNNNSPDFEHKIENMGLVCPAKVLMHLKSVLLSQILIFLSPLPETNFHLSAQPMHKQNQCDPF